MNNKKILITGAKGFIGSHLCKVASEKGLSVRRVLRSGKGEKGDIVTDINPKTDWSSTLENVDVVIHLAARVHVKNERSVNPMTDYRIANVDGTLNIARQATAAGVKRFIFLSSVKVNGENTIPNHPFKERDLPSPQTPYGVSKFEAEKGLLQLSESTAMETVIIRPPLVYGPRVKGNFLSMLGWLYRGTPLPLDAIDNKRSLVGIDNLLDFITICINHPSAANQIFFVSDGSDLSTTNLIRNIAKAMGRRAWLFPISTSKLKTCATLIGRQDVVQRLCGSLQVDISKAKDLLGWSPPYCVDEGIEKTVNWFKQFVNFEQ